MMDALDWLFTTWWGGVLCTSLFSLVIFALIAACAPRIEDDWR